MSLSLDPETWEPLARALDLAAGVFSLHAVDAPTPLIADELARRFTASGRLTHLDRLTGDQAAAAAWGVPAEAAVWIITPEERSEGPLTRGWQTAFRRLNRVRNHLQRSFRGALLVVGPAWFHRLVWEEAIDFWSGREGPWCFSPPPELAGLPDRFEPWADYSGTAPEYGVDAPTRPALARLLEERAERLTMLGAHREAGLWRVRALIERARFSDRGPLMEALRGFFDGDVRLAARAKLAWISLAEGAVEAPRWQAELADLAAAPLPDALDRLVIHLAATRLRLPEAEVWHHLAAAAELAGAEAPVSWQVAWQVAAAEAARARLADPEGAVRHGEAAARWVDEAEAGGLATRRQVLAEAAERQAAFAPLPEALSAGQAVVDEAARVGDAVAVRHATLKLCQLRARAGEPVAEPLRALEAQFAAEGDVASTLLVRLERVRQTDPLAEGRALLAEVVAGLEGLGHRHGVAAAQGHQADIEFGLGETERAQRLYQAALRTYQVLGDGLGEASVLRGLATVAFRQGDVTGALRLEEQALAYFTRRGHRRERAIALEALATLLGQRGDVHQALRLQREALAELEALQDRAERASLLLSMARHLSELGERAEALRLVDEALAEYQTLHRRRGRALALQAKARLIGDIQPDEAFRLHTEALAEYEALGRPDDRANALGHLARLRADQGELEEALRLSRQVVQMFTDLGARRSRAVALGDVANWLAGLGRPGEAQAILAEILVDFTAMGAPQERALTLYRLGKVHLAQGRADEAYRHLHASLQEGRRLKLPQSVAAVGRLILSHFRHRLKPSERRGLEREVAKARPHPR